MQGQDTVVTRNINNANSNAIYCATAQSFWVVTQYQGMQREKWANLPSSHFIHNGYNCQTWGNRIYSPSGIGIIILPFLAGKQTTNLCFISMECKATLM